MAWIEPVEAAARLRHLPGLALLDSAMRSPELGRYSHVAADPFGVFRVDAGRALWNDTALPDQPIAALRKLLADFKCTRIVGLPPFQGGAVGAFAYEFGWRLEGRVPPDPPLGDDVYLSFYDTILAFDHETATCWLIASGLPEPLAGRQSRAQARLASFAALLEQPAAAVPVEPPHIVWRKTMAAAAYRDGVERVRASIAAGDIYQANLAQRFVAPIPQGADLWSLYRHLRSANPAPFAAYLDCGARTILSMSPELFLRTQGRRVETRPIKGTARREDERDADAAAAARLLASRKDRAENVMIVDLLRNDLSKVATPLSVEVPALCALESYAGLHHLVSVVTGTLRDDADALDLIAASFPGGSITGAPKLRAMEIIAEIEGLSRGVYCGALGAIGFDGDVTLAIAIRTLVADDATIELRVGGGITILSDPRAEYEETLVKARRIFEAAAPIARHEPMPSPA